MKSLITEPLGLYGWKRTEPVLLAALLSEEPLLLVGAHGCAKSFVLERLAEALGMAFRSYNASLINYDDLVGVPPDRTAVIIGEGVAKAKPHLRRGLALATYLALRERADIPATTVELLAHEIRPAIDDYENTHTVTPDKSRIARAAGARVADANQRFGAESEFAQYHANLLNSYLPDDFADTREVNEASADFENLWKEAGL